MTVVAVNVTAAPVVVMAVRIDAIRKKQRSIADSRMIYLQIRGVGPWLRDNPLTARVMVNRLWHYHFGTGIVSTPSDLGKNGTPPSHPELLDYLANKFREDHWSVKSLIRDIVTSKTYRMSSTPSDPGAEEKDPANDLLHRARQRRAPTEP